MFVGMKIGIIGMCKLEPEHTLAGQIVKETQHIAQKHMIVHIETIIQNIGQWY